MIALLGLPLSPDSISADMMKLGLTRTDLIAMGLLEVAVIIVLLLPFFWLAVWRGKNWARWVLFIAFIATLPIIFLDPSVFDTEHLPLIGVEFVSILVEAAAFYFLFTGDARPWFSTRR